MSTLPPESPTLAPIAFGRYLVDLPQGIILIDWFQSFQGVGKLKITKNKFINDFEKLVKERIEYYKSIPHKQGGTLLEKVVKLNLPMCTTLIYWDNKWFKNDVLADCEEYYLYENTLYSSNGTIFLDKERQDAYFRCFERTVGAIRIRNNQDVPTEPGSCFDGSILLDGPDRYYGDLIMATALWPDRPDVSFGLTVSANGKRPDPPLLTRLKSADAIPPTGVLRSRGRVVNEMPGEEHLERVKENNGTASHLFIWETQGLPSRFDHPQIRLSLTTGDGKDRPVNSSLSDEDALKLWDAVLESLRWRPTVPPTKPGPTTLKPPSRSRSRVHQG